MPPCGEPEAAAAAATAMSVASAHRTAAAATGDYRLACPGPARRRRAACLVLVRTDVAQRPQASLRPGTPLTGVGYGPPSLQNAYALPSANAGSGQRVAVVDAYDDPNAEADPATYRGNLRPGHRARKLTRPARPAHRSALCAGPLRTDNDPGDSASNASQVCHGVGRAGREKMETE